jgi:ligand-binding sensor domain-containing protein
MRIFFPFLLLLTFGIQLPAQTDTIFPPLTIGQWRQHLPWQRARYVTQSQDKVFFSTEWALIELEKSDRSSRFITKVEGLSDVGISLLKYSPAAKLLLITYTNSNIDLFYPDDQSVLNLPIIQKNRNIVGDKQIYNVFFDGKKAYFACGFGVLKFDLEDAEAEYTVFTGIPVRSFAIYNGYLWAGTEDGLFRLPENDINPADFSRWEEMTESAGFPSSISYNEMALWNGQLWMGAGKRLLRYDGAAVMEMGSHPIRSIKYLSTEGAGLMAAWGDPNDFGRGIIEYFETNDVKFQLQDGCDAILPVYGIEDGTKKFWLADLSDKFRYYDLTTGNCDQFAYDTPYAQRSSEIAFASDGTTYVATPGPAPNLGVVGYRDGVYRFKNEVWKTWSERNTPEIVDSEESFKDMWKVAVRPSDNHVFVGGWQGGMLHFDASGNFVRRYSKSNSILQNAGNSGLNRTAIGGLAFDQNENLWISNYGASSPIAVLKPDGTLLNFDNAPSGNLLQVAVDKNGYKWFVLAFSSGILVYDSGADLESEADDRYKVITTANSVLPTNFINCITVDLDGDVWVGTQQGAVSFECGANVFDDCKGRRRIVNVDGFNGYLLETEDVKTIAVDGANQKWFGTTNGVFVQSPDALTQVARFTNTNSPLFDNAITDIAVNPVTGEAWIGTEKGLISLRTGATEGGRVNRPGAYAYPNPVQPGYDGPIAIYGLARDANIKVTDAAGRLVYEGKALGGQAVWDGRDYLGRRVASGVYLIYATSQATFDEPDAIVTKLVFLH